MVPELRAEADLSDDFDDHRALQRTCRCLSAVDSVLKTIGQELESHPTGLCASLICGHQPTFEK